ncbi:MAG: hypothetical protein OEO82_12155 [Gammaproteobacteria bacterium]|nr:hypothetical protein [Gammaproteobacteria bacterium]
MAADGELDQASDSRYGIQVADTIVSIKSLVRPDRRVETVWAGRGVAAE